MSLTALQNPEQWGITHQYVIFFRMTVEKKSDCRVLKMNGNMKKYTISDENKLTQSLASSSVFKPNQNM